MSTKARRPSSVPPRTPVANRKLVPLPLPLPEIKANDITKNVPKIQELPDVPPEPVNLDNRPPAPPPDATPILVGGVDVSQLIDFGSGDIQPEPPKVSAPILSPPPPQPIKIKVPRPQSPPRKPFVIQPTAPIEPEVVKNPEPTETEIKKPEQEVKHPEPNKQPELEKVETNKQPEVEANKNPVEPQQPAYKMSDYNKQVATKPQNQMVVVPDFTIAVPDYDSMKPEQQAAIRARFITQFGSLRKTWPDYYIPELTPDMSLSTIHVQYETYVRHIKIQKSVEDSRIYLILMWLAIQFCCKKFLNIDLSGYVEAQMKSINKYDLLLAELGESKYKQSGGQLQEIQYPVELRIIWIAVVNAGIFLLVKYMGPTFGEENVSNVTNKLGDFLAGPTQPIGAPGRQQQDGVKISEVPQNQNSGMDIGKMLGTFGPMLMNMMGNNNAPVKPVAEQQKPNMVPAYNE